VTWEPLLPDWSPADVDATAVWARSGAQWLTAPGVGVPERLVRSIAGIAAHLDDSGVGVSGLTGGNPVALLAERAAVMGFGPAGRDTCGGAGRLVCCGDGWLALSLTRAADVDLVPAWLETDLPDLESDPWPAVEAAVAHRSATELGDRAAELGLACAVVGETVDHGPVRVDRVGDAPAHRCAGALVVNLSALWAGPLAGDLLARLGARVVKVESVGRPDGGRRARRFFQALHGRCESVALDFTTDRGRGQLAELLARADVVIEGSRPRALEQLGIDARQVAAGGPVVWLSITGHGRVGAAAQRVGFGDDAAAGGGLVGEVGGEPRFVADAVADPLTGLVAASTVVQLLERGGRWMVDVALARVAASMSPVAHGATAAAHPDRPRPRRDPGAALPLGRDTDRVLAEFDIEP